MRQVGLLAAAWLWVGGAGCRGCQETPAEPELTLEEAADQVTFASVEQFGSHTMLTTALRTEVRGGTTTSQHEEIAEIRWQDWDNFSYHRTVDQEPAEDLVVVKGRAWLRRQGGNWDPRRDAENYRVQLRTTWNTWDQMLVPFGERVTLTDAGTETIEGRSARKYAISLAPLPEGAAPKPGRLEPLSLSGAVWVDEATAVRLLGEVEGTLQQGDYRRTVKLQLALSNIGQPQDIQPPARPGRGKAKAKQEKGPE